MYQQEAFSILQLENRVLNVIVGHKDLKRAYSDLVFVYVEIFLLYYAEKYFKNNL